MKKILNKLRSWIKIKIRDWKLRKQLKKSKDPFIYK